MQAYPLTKKVAHPFYNVKSSQTNFSPPDPEPVIHHNVPERKAKIIIYSNGTMESTCYGVSSSSRVLTPGLLVKKFDAIRDCLQYTLGLSVCQREATLTLLRYWAYYGNVYPTAAMITENIGCSKATFWRTITFLQTLGLIKVVNRYILRPHAQISNLYLLHNLIIVLARYLAEHGQGFAVKWLSPWLSMPGSTFWPLFRSGRLTAFLSLAAGGS